MIKRTGVRKFGYKKSCSSIGSTYTAKTDMNFIFDYYSTPKLGVRQQIKYLIRRITKWI